jgi:hypothetical protein
MSVADFGLVYVEADWPYGLMCAQCPHVFREGERYTTDLYAFSDGIPMVRVLCVWCATAWRSGSEPSAPPA